jgi:phosphoribosylamine--glycine ligase
MTLEEAHAAVDDMLADNRFGDAGARIVIEEFLAGEEASFIVMCDGKTSCRWPPARTTSA